MVVIAQLSDTHISAGPDGVVDDGSPAVCALRAALASVLALPVPPDAVIVTGDLTDRGLPAEYACLRHLLDELPMPVYVLPGNHDDRSALRAAFPSIPSGGRPAAPVQYTADVAGVRVVCCDSTVPGEAGGTMDEERLGWIDRTLAEEPGMPTLVAFHHPPFLLGVRFLDDMSLDGRGPLAAVLGRHRHVVRVVSGHVHRGAVASFAGTVAVTCPSTYQQVYLDLGRPGRAAVTAEPAAFTVHAVEPEAMSAVSHFVPVGEHHPVICFD